MRLYSGTSKEFIEDTTLNRIGDKLKNAFFDYFRYNPSPNEVDSWRNSLRAVAQVFQYADLLDHGVILEYQLPTTSKRLDCLITGKDRQNENNAVIIELKQWERCNESEGINEVLTYVGGAQREVLHPSVQVGQYKMYLEDSNPVFYRESAPIRLNACTYLHNYPYDNSDPIYSEKFTKALESFPLFSADEVDGFRDYLIDRLEKGQGIGVKQEIENSVYKPSKKLMDHVGNIIKNKNEYTLLDEQLIVYDKIISEAKANMDSKKKTVIIVKGGPGTGKSVIALNVMADLLLAGHNAQYATGSKAFTETLRKVIGSRGAPQFKYFNSYANAEHNEIDVLIADEAHRIRETSNNRFTKKINRSTVPQIEELIKVAKVMVFFIDDKQIVRPNEIGHTDYIKEYAIKHNCTIHEYELTAQFRCQGSDGFVNWIDNTLGIRRTANVIWDKKEEFDFRIVESPLELYQEISKKNYEVPNSARLVAGFCWPWTNPLPDGTLENDVVIDDFTMPWEGKDGFRLSKEIPPASLWAHDPNGVKQVGTVYTVQGFEFDYIGVIVGKDLTYNFDNQMWIGNPENSSDSTVKRSKEKFTEMVKNTYRVLLSRGMKGCYVYFVDKDTERFFKSRMEG